MDTGLCCFCSCLFSILFLPPIVLETCASLSPYWVKFNASSDCFVGILYNLNCPENTTGLGSSIVNLQLTAFAFTVAQIPFSLTVGIAFQLKETDFIMFCGGCSLLLFLVLYPISGILAFAGCILILRDYPDFERGWSFDLCLASSILILIEIIITMAFIRVIGSSKTKSDGKSEEAFEAKDNNKDAEAQTQSNTHGYSIMRFAQVAITVGAKAAKNVIGVK